jgi:Cytochrome P450
LLGVLPKLLRDPLQTLVDAATRFGNVVYLGSNLFYRVYLVNHPTLIKHVLQDHPHRYSKHPSVNRIKPLFGEGLTTSDGALWQQQRRLTAPAFQHRRIIALLPLIMKTTAEMLERWRPFARSGKPINLVAEMMYLTRIIIIRALFGSEDGAGLTAFNEALTTALEHLNQRVWAFFNLPAYLPTPRNRQFQRALRTLDAFVYRRIQERHRKGVGTEDLLSMLLDLREEETGASLSNKQLRDEIMTMVIAGHTTAAAVLAWTAILISQHPAVHRQLYEELHAVTPGRLAVIPVLTYTRMVINESMRLYPPTWVTARTPIEDDDIGGYRIPAGAVVLLSPYVMHRYPEFWDSPEDFDPNRFGSGRSAGRPHYAYFPFGGGPRVCIGKGFALMEMQLILAMVARHYTLHLVPEQQLKPEPGITLRPPQPVLFTLQPQEGATT